MLFKNDPSFIIKGTVLNLVGLLQTAVYIYILNLALNLVCHGNF